MSDVERPYDPREVAGAARAAAWRQERIRLGHAVDEDGYSLPPVSDDAVAGESALERHMRRMVAADRLAFPDEWDDQP